MHPDDKNSNDNDDNVISLSEAAERKRLQIMEEAARNKPPHEPFFKSGTLFNLPPVTKYMLLTFLSIHILTDMVLSDPQQYDVFMNFGFVPGYYTGTLPFGWAALIGPITFTFLHGSWTHMILNGFMMMAFGTGVEKWIGGKRLFIFFMLCNIFAALAQFVFSPLSTAPVIGASGGLSGLFAAVLLMMQQQNGLGAGNRYGILPFIILWIAISVIFGMVGGPDGNNVAWAAHIGGFLAGFVLFKPIVNARFLN